MENNDKEQPEELSKPDEVRGIQLKQIAVDPETGAVTSKVYYGPDFKKIYKRFKDFNDDFDKFTSFPEIRKDDVFMQIFKGLKYLIGQYKKNLKDKYPKDFKSLKDLQENQLRELIQNKLKEVSATGAGATAGTFTPGEGAQYATPYAFNPNKKAKGAQNIYYYKLGWKPVDTKKLHKQAKGIEHKDLWKENQEMTKSYVDSLNLQEPALKNFISSRMEDFDKIEEKLNVLIPLLKQAKTKTSEYYKTSPDYKVQYSTDLAVDYLDDLITLFKEKK